MPSAKDIRSAVRADLEKDLRAREDAVVSVARALDRYDEQASKLAEAATEAAKVITDAGDLVKLTDLARFLDRPVKDLRALAKTTDTPAGKTASAAAADDGANDPETSAT